MKTTTKNQRLLFGKKKKLNKPVEIKKDEKLIL